MYPWSTSEQGSSVRMASYSDSDDDYKPSVSSSSRAMAKEEWTMPKMESPEIRFNMDPPKLDVRSNAIPIDSKFDWTNAASVDSDYSAESVRSVSATGRRWMDEDSYRAKRDRNNQAVKKCRFRAKIREKEMEMEFKKNKRENGELKDRVKRLEQDLEIEQKKTCYLMQLVKMVRGKEECDDL